MKSDKEKLPEEKENSRWYQLFLNKYAIVGALFVVWMFFFDRNSFFIHRELDKETRELVQEKNKFEKKLKEESIQYKKMTHDPDAIEKVAREKHFLKKEGEDVFIVEERVVKKTEENGEPK